MEDQTQWYRAQLRRIFGGKRWIVAMDILAAAASTAQTLHDLGAPSILCVAASPGAGANFDPAIGPEPIVFDVAGTDMMSSIRASMALLAHLPTDAVARVDAFDPEHATRVVGTIFDDGSPVAGRSKYGARPRSWQALEDKTVVDALWDAVGVPRAPSRIVGSDEPAALLDATAALDEGAGTVWAADSREGFHGGASFTRRVTTAEQGIALQRAWADQADSIRVMPFLDGIPCSIHGIVFDDRVVVLRPCEMIVLRRPNGEFHYGRAGSFWDPRPDDRASMRELARRTGVHLRSSYDYRGAFTIDGVMTADGFRPTELNPRFGAALDLLCRSLGLPMTLLNLAVVEGEPVDWKPAELEALLLTAADGERTGGTVAITSVPCPETERLGLRWRDGAFHVAAADEEPDASVLFGPHPAGGFLSISFAAATTPVGPSAAPRAAAALAWADAHWNLGIGRLEPAPDLRR